jgi:hypothetical protein
VLEPDGSNSSTARTTSLKLRELVGIPLMLCVLLSACAAAWAGEKAEDPAGRASKHSEQAGRLFEMKVPQGFRAESTDEPGILKWKKKTAEIYLVVGDLFSDSDEILFDAVRRALIKNEKLENVRTIPLKGGRAVAYVEKAAKSGERTRTLRLFVVTSQKTIIVDFTAPVKDFEAFAPEFEAALKSFKLKSSES